MDIRRNNDLRSGTSLVVPKIKAAGHLCDWKALGIEDPLSPSALVPWWTHGEVNKPFIRALDKDPLS
ncbi:hypothetical protein OsI_11846 [Oryza sativa Indica Group]|uniref:Uncharacterized protein n=1 Tax=Oryza sativa subsp. indica TaxID=39946 RepID=B8AQK6_ORYSI|nr:hypothetical protein OsI_11846 [Oryza sativa Indica Group]